MRPTKNYSQNKPARKVYFSKKKYCIYCKDRIRLVDYKNYKMLERFILETGKILPARVSGACPYHQKQITKAIKRARHMALIMYIEPKRG
jgi:small subunit ribosomal protein S18